MDLWKTDPDLYARVERELAKQEAALPYAEVIEILAQRGYSLKEVNDLADKLKEDCKYKALRPKIGF